VIYAHEVAGKVREALAYTEEALLQQPDDLRLGAGILGFSPYVWLVLFRGGFLVDLGRYDEGRAQLDRAIELAREQGELETLGLAHSLYSIYGRCAGEVDLTLNHARTAVEIAERIGSPLSRSLAYRALGVARLMREEWSEAANAFQLALAIAHESRTAVWADAHSLADLAEAYLGMGRLELARETIERALGLTRGRQLKWAKPHVDLTLARIRIRSEGARARREIEPILQGVIRAAKEGGFKPWLPFAELELAELARLAGDGAAREHALRQAHQLFTEMGAAGYARTTAQQLEARGGSEPSPAPAA
jgi:tetratricopeptide (TPR) repeat protein